MAPSKLCYTGCGIAFFYLAVFTSSGFADNVLGDARVKQVSADPAPLTFAWPVPGRVTVTETALKKGRTAVFRYDLITKPILQSNDIEVSYGPFEFISIEGLDLQSPEIRKQLAPSMAMMSALPSFRINPAGELVDVIGFKEMLDRVLNTSLLAGNIDNEVRQRIKTMLTDPSTIETLKTKIADYWNAWVGAWVGLPNDPGAAYNSNSTNIAYGVSIPYKVAIKQQALKKIPKGQKVQFRLTSQADNDAMKTAIAGMLEKAASNPEQKNTFRKEMLEQAARQSTIGIITDPQTLKPELVLTETLVTIKIAGEDSQKQIERHKYEFDWLKGARE